MSKASREWKASCKEDNRQTDGTSWARENMTLKSYMQMKRNDQHFMKKSHMVYLKGCIVELDAGKGIAFNPLEEE